MENFRRAREGKDRTRVTRVSTSNPNLLQRNETEDERERERGERKWIPGRRERQRDWFISQKAGSVQGDSTLAVPAESSRGQVGSQEQEPPTESSRQLALCAPVRTVGRRYYRTSTATDTTSGCVHKSAVVNVPTPSTLFRSTFIFEAQSVSSVGGPRAGGVARVRCGRSLTLLRIFRPHYTRNSDDPSPTFIALSSALLHRYVRFTLERQWLLR